MSFIRKHYLDTHRTGYAALIENEANRAAAMNPGERVEIIAGHAVSVIGDPPAGAVAAFAADAERHGQAVPLAA